jgi:serine/threonine protein kinase
MGSPTDQAAATRTAGTAAVADLIDQTIAQDGAVSGAGPVALPVRVGLDLQDMSLVMRTAVPLPGAVEEATQASTRGDSAPPPVVDGAFGASKLVDGFRLAPGTSVNCYELIRQLGRGGMGEVWAAYDTRLGRQVAIKFLLSKASQKRSFRERFLAEARATAQFNHENIVIIHDVGEFSGMSYLVLEYLEGEPLSARLKDRKVPWAQAVQMMIPVVRALAEAHTAGIVHRDLKPANVFVLRTGGIKVLDFGLAKLFGAEPIVNGGTATLPVDAEAVQARAEAVALAGGTAGGTSAESTPGTATSGSLLRTAGPSGGRRKLHDGADDLTEAGAIMGTYAFMSPEQWGLAPVDAQSDLWAVGVILFMMLSGDHPFGSKATNVILHHIMQKDQPVRSVRELAPEVPEAVARVVTRCLVKDKTQRIATAQELLAALESLVAGGSGRQVLREDQSPYLGLAPFTERDAHRFFGRDAEIARFISKLKDWPTLAVIGPSGAGKSSFVRAGVVPALLGGGEDWDVMVCRPGRDPFAAVAEGLVGVSEVTVTSDGRGVAEAAKAAADLARQLREEPGRLGATLRTRARAGGRPVLLYLDQFEELFTLVEDTDVRDRFATAVASVAVDASTPVRVILSMRSDFLDRVSECRALMDAVTRELTILQQPTGDGLRDAIIRPAALAGYSFEDEAMVDEMVRSLASETAALPLLQFAAQKLWEERDRDKKLLTRAAYRAMGGVEGALVRHADAVIQGMSRDDRASVRTLLQRLVTPEGTRALLSLDELRSLFDDAGTAQRLLHALTDARLLVVQAVGEAEGDARVEIVHESLITRWQTLRRWLDESHEDAAMLAQLRDAARQWEARGRVAGLLWTGDAVDEARVWRRRSAARLTPQEDAFLAAAFRFAERAMRRRRVLLGVGVTIMGLVTAGALVGSWFIREASQRAKREAERARVEATRATREAERASAAERQVRDQMTRLAEETDRAKKAETLASTRLREVEQSQAREKQTQGVLKRSYEDLEKALEKAQRAEKVAIDSREVAQRASGLAKEAADAERKARERLEVLLRKEREENQRLRQMRVRIYQELPVTRRRPPATTP